MPVWVFTNKTLSFYSSHFVVSDPNKSILPFWTALPIDQKDLNKVWGEKNLDWTTTLEPFGRDHCRTIITSAPVSLLGDFLDFCFGVTEPQGEVAYVSFRNQVKRSSGNFCFWIFFSFFFICFFYIYIFLFFKFFLLLFFHFSFSFQFFFILFSIIFSVSKEGNQRRVTSSNGFCKGLIVFG